MRVYDSKTGYVHPEYQDEQQHHKPPDKSAGAILREALHGGMKPCRVCKKSVAAKAKVCPHCGIKKPGEGSFVHGINSIANYMIGIGALAFLLYLLVSCSV